MARSFDYIVVGAGVEGLSAARYLAESGHRTLLLEQFPWPHTRGSSPGESRIIRYAHSDPYYSAIMPECYEEWRKLERQSNNELLKITGALIAISDVPAATAPWSASLKNVGIDDRRLELPELRRRFPQFAYPDDFVGFWDPHGGLLVANKCLLALMNAFKLAGGTFIDRAPVVELNRLGPGQVDVVTEHLGIRTSYRAKGVAAAPGPWSKKFAQKHFKLSLPIESCKTILTYWKETVPNTYSCEKNCPVLLYKDVTRKNYYYLKADYEFSGLVQFGTLQFGTHSCVPVDPDERDKVDLSYYLDVSKDFCKKTLPFADPSAPALIAPCMYTENRYDEDYIIDQIPRFPEAVIACGWSGTGFKVAPVVGRMMAELLTGTKPKYDLSKFRISRFPNAQL